SGSITANAGTNLNTSALALESTQASVVGSKAAGTAAASSTLIGGVYNTSLPTLTNGQQAAAQFDSSGRLIINCATGCSGGGGGGGTSSAFGSAFPTDGTAVGMSDGTDMVAFRTTDGTSLDVAVVGTVAATQSGTWILGANSGVDIGDVTVNN